MQYALAYRLILCCLLVNSDLQDNRFDPKLDVDTSAALFRESDVLQAAIVEFPDCRVLVFRGTLAHFKTNGLDTTKDWAKNFLIAQQKHPTLPGRVHSGFLREFKHSWAATAGQPPRTIMETLRNTKPDKPLYVTGYSQGGALAILATAALHDEKIPVGGTITFAAPRLGDADFCQYCRKTFKVQRFEFRYDIVPLLPPSATERKKVEQIYEASKQLTKLWTDTKKAQPWEDFFKPLAQELTDYEPIGTLHYLEPALRIVEAQEEPKLVRQRWRRYFLRSVVDPKVIKNHHSIQSYVQALAPVGHQAP